MNRISFMDDDTLKVVSVFTPVGSCWPIGSHFYIKSMNAWCTAITDSFKRTSEHLGELEANAKGFFMHNRNSTVEMRGQKR